MLGAAFTVGKFGYAAVTGLDAFVDTSARFAVKLALRSREIDLAAAEEMVREMRARVPRDTGRLFNGIAFEVMEGGTVEVYAAAHNPWSGINYAGFVERGTRAGTRGRKASYVADSNYFILSTAAGPGRSYGRSRLQQRTHPGTEAQPFFFPVAEEVLARRGLSLEEAIDDAAGEDFA